MSVVIPDPGFTLSEAANIDGVLRWFIARSRQRGDAVLESACQKLHGSMRQAMELHPDEWEAIEREVAMQKRFGLNA